mgnify:CR=1 FL=1
MAKKNESISSVTTEEGSNYAGQQGGFTGGFTETDKQYLSTLLTTPSPRRAPKEQRKGISAGNYYGSVIGNVPLFTAQAPTIPVDTIDDMYHQDQMMKMQLLKQDAVKIPEISRGAFNDVFFNGWKGLMDTKYNEITAAFKGDSSKALAYMKQDPGYRHMQTQLSQVADEYNVAIKNISDIMSDPDSEQYIPPSAQRKMMDVLNHPENVEKSFKRDSKGRVIDVDLSETNKLLNTFRAFPSVLKSTKDITGDYERKIAGDMNPANFGNSSNDAFMAYTKTNENFTKSYKDSEGNTIPSDLDVMTDSVMKSVYGGLDPEEETFKETRDIVRDTINLRVKRAVEKQYQVISSENAKKNLLMETLGQGDIEVLAYDATGDTFTPTKAKDGIGFDANTYYKNPSTVGIRSGERYVSPSHPGVKFEILEPEKLEFSLVNQYSGEYTVNPIDYYGQPAYIQKEITKNKGSMFMAGLYQMRIPTATINLQSVEKGITTTVRPDGGRKLDRQNNSYASKFKVKVYSDEFPMGKEEEWSGSVDVLTSANDVNYLARSTNDGFALKYNKDSQDKTEKGNWTRTIVTPIQANEGGVTTMGVKVKEGVSQEKKEKEKKEKKEIAGYKQD